MNYRVIVKFKDGSQCNLDADYISYGEDGIAQIWKGERTLVGIYNMSDIAGLCLSASEKKENKNER